MKLEEIVSVLNKAKTPTDVLRTVNLFINSNKISDKYSQAIQKKLKASINFENSLQSAYNYLLNQQFPTKTKDTVTRNHWFKGTAIRGMEVSNPNR